MEKVKQDKIIWLANKIGSEGDHNSREFAKDILKLFNYNINPDDAHKVFKYLKPLYEKYLGTTFLPWKPDSKRIKKR